jgi:uncharacterized membrane protein SpoIIM required for sporulation
VDLDVFVSRHSVEWARLEQLIRLASKPRRLSGPEVDELVELYQRTATHLSVVQSNGGDPVLVGRLSSIVARGRGAVTGTRRGALRDVLRFFTVDFPAVLYRARWWWLGATGFFLVVSVAWTVFLLTHPDQRNQIASPDAVQQLVNHDFKDYYTQAPAHDFAAKVFTNNAFLALLTIGSGLLLGIPIVFLLYQNALNVAVDASLLIAGHRTGLFFGLIIPHGLLELTTIFVSAGLGMKLGWTVVDPGRRTRAQALAEEGRALVIGGIGTTVMLLISGILEAFVTPSGLPTWARIGIGVLVECGFLFVVFVPGRRAVQAGVTGDLDLERRGDTLPTSG